MKTVTAKKIDERNPVPNYQYTANVLSVEIADVYL